MQLRSESQATSKLWEKELSLLCTLEKIGKLQQIWKHENYKNCNALDFHYTCIPCLHLSGSKLDGNARYPHLQELMLIHTWDHQRAGHHMKPEPLSSQEQIYGFGLYGPVHVHLHVQAEKHQEQS